MLTSEELRQIRRITLQADRRVDSMFAGGYRSAFKGRGMEFEEVRPYVPGDDVRHIDWNVTARTQLPHVKEFREERELTLVLAVDVSASMNFGSGGLDGATDKRRLMARIAGALAYAAIRNNDKVGLLVFGGEVERFVPPRKSRGHAWRVIHEIFDHQARTARTDVVGALDYLNRVIRRRAVVALVSDFLDGGAEPERLDRALGGLAARHRLHTFLVHDPHETRASPPPDERGRGWARRLLGGWILELEDAETGQRRCIDTARLERTADLDAALSRQRRAGASASAIATDEDPFRALQQHFRRQGRRR
jgi:uncharacterized protein (DUF58 family)